MKLVRSPRITAAALLLGTASLVAALAASSTAATTAVPNTVTGKLIKPAHGTLAQGTVVHSSALGQRVFTTAGNGFALANVGGAQYPAATTDGGAVWKTDGPALHLDAAQGPLAVVSVGAASRRTIYAFGTGSAVDVTSDGGKHWYQALFQGESMAVVPGISGHLVAFVDGNNATWQYVSKNGGRTWAYDPAVGGS
jgi:hypothetical protein